MDLDGQDFEKKIYVKLDAGPLAGRDLGREKLQGEHIAIGTATDPYQPAEREFGATRAILEQMAARKGLSISITTKSDQVLRDVDLLRRIAEHSSCFRESEHHHHAHAAWREFWNRARLVPICACALFKNCAARGSRREFSPCRSCRALPIGRGPGRPGAGGARCRGSVVCRERVVSDAFGAETFSAVSGAKVSQAARERYREWYSRDAYAPEAYRKEIATRVAALREKIRSGSAPSRSQGGQPEPNRQLSLGLEVAMAARESV